MMDRVVEHTVTWHYPDRPKDKRTTRYITAATSEYRLLAESIAATELTQEDLDSIEEYRRACEESAVVIVGRPKRRRLQ